MQSSPSCIWPDIRATSNASTHTHTTMKQEQKPAVFGSSAEAAALRCGNTVCPSKIGSISRSSVGLDEETSTMASCSALPPHHRLSSSAPVRPCGVLAANNPVVTTSPSGVVGSVAVTVPTTPSTMMPSSRDDNDGSNMISSSSSSFSSSSSSLCFSSCCSPTSSSSPSTTSGLLRSLGRQGSTSCGRHCCHPLPFPPLPPPPSAAEASKISGCCFFPHEGKQQVLHPWWQEEEEEPPRFSCGGTAGKNINCCSGRRYARRLSVPLILQLPAITLTTLLLLLLPQGPQEAAAQLKFAAIGNWGFESGSQQQVAETLKKVAHTEHISFLVSPGSNFAGGVTGPNDPKWKRLFEDVYSDPDGALKMPFFTVLGAEDWSGDYTCEAVRTEVAYSSTADYTGTGATGSTAAPAGEATENEAEKEEESSAAAAEAAAAARKSQITQTCPKWTLPNWWYHYLMHFSANTGSAFINSGHKDMSVGLIFLDTWVLSSSFPFADIRTKAWEDTEKTLSLAPKFLDYIIVVTDRPVYSSGSSKGDSGLQYYLKPLLEKADIDILISGYDLSQEVIVHNGISYVNCGAGSFAVGSSMVKDAGSQFYSGQPGFCVFELTADGIITQLVDGTNGETLFVHKQALKKRPERKTIDAFKFVNQLPEVKYWAVPSMGKMPGRDVFVRVVGTIGLCIATFFASLSVASLVSRYTK